MSIFMQSPDERRRAWRDLRQELANYDDFQQLKRVAQWWSHCPISRWSIDWDQPHSWPLPWEMLHNNFYCRNAVTFMMYQTLMLSNPSHWAGRLKIHGIRCKQEMMEDQWLVLEVDGTWFLNYSVGEVSDHSHFDQYCRILFSYDENDISTKVS